MQITTLGALAVDGRPVRGERLAKVVRALIDARGRAVSTGALVEAVWDGDPPADVTGAVQALVSRVRRTGLPVVAVDGGYRIPADRVRVDAVDARALVDRARAALREHDADGARRAADAARALLPEVPELVDRDQVRLLSAVATVRAEAALAGHGPLDDADLRRLAAHTPPDEPAAALLVRVLAAAGRHAEALEVIDHLRAELAQRYGTDPSPVVAQAHLALLRGELGPAKPEPAPKAAPASRRTLVQVMPASWRREGTLLVGRDVEVATVAEAVGHAPLVTVVGPGGAGKTRLAAAVTRHVAAGGRNVRVLELAGLRSADEVLASLLATVSGTPNPTHGAAERLRAVAQDLDGLVVLDNCEHLLDAAAALVAELLAVTAPEVTVLATSRAPLGLAGEVVHRLRMLRDEDALALLETRARAGGAEPTWDSGGALELCHRLDNLPLALELAAARLRHMPITDVIAGLADRFGLLDDALRGLPDRHASLWAMVDWSRELLAPADRELLARLAVIPAPFLAETAAAVAAPTIPGGRSTVVGGDVARGLATLVEQSLLSFDAGEVGPPRYRMLETVREYGEVRLGAAGERDTAMAGLVGWARAHAVALSEDFIGPGQLVALASCAADQDTLLAALRWSIGRHDDAAAVDIAVALFHVWTVRGLHLEVIAWATLLVAADDPLARRDSAILHPYAPGRALPDADRLTWVCLLIGVNGGVTGSSRLPALARTALRRLLAQRRDEVSPRAAAVAAAMPALESARPEVGLEAATALLAEPDPYVQGFGFFLRAAVRENSGLPGSPVADAEEAYHRFEAAGDHWGMGMAAQGIGQWIGARGEGDADAWLSRGERHLELVGAIQDARSIRMQLDIRLAVAGDDAAASRLADASTSPQAEPVDAAQAHLGLAQVALHQRRYGEVLAHADAVVAAANHPSIVMAQVRMAFRVAGAVLRLQVSDELGLSDVEHARLERDAVALLVQARADAAMQYDMTGSWALGGAELAAHRGALDQARELWGLAGRLGANVAHLFHSGHGERLTAALGEEDDRERLLARLRKIPVAQAAVRVRELMDDLLTPSSGTPAAPTA